MITIIVAFDDNKLIGTEKGLPWHVPEEFKHFKATTLGCPVIMGRKTWETLPKRPLPGRTNIVISRTQSFENALTARSVEEAIQKAQEEGPREIFILGGLEVYKASLGLADRILASHIKGKWYGMIYFPDITDWKVHSIEYHDKFDVLEYRKT